MTPIIEDAILGSDLDARSFVLTNLGGLSPVPPGLALSTDPRLTDARPPLDGSITNASVAAAAAIDQSKLNLNGPIPAAWLGGTSATAAPGHLAEYTARKGAANGYASLDATGKVPMSQIPSEVGTGSVTSVDLTMPSQFTVGGPHPITTSGVWAVNWVPVTDLSWFGNKEGSAGSPRFYTSALPVSLIPNMSADKIVSGTVNPARLPDAVYGAGHAAGMVPDPGPVVGGQDPTKFYLARNMTYQPVPDLSGPAYAPTIPDPILSKTTPVGGETTVSIREDLSNVPVSGVDGCTFFYSTTSGSTGFKEFPSVAYIKLPSTGSIWAYAARPGYKDSNTVTLALT